MCVCVCVERGTLGNHLTSRRERGPAMRYATSRSIFSAMYSPLAVACAPEGTLPDQNECITARCVQRCIPGRQTRGHRSRDGLS